MSQIIVPDEQFDQYLLKAEDLITCLYNEPVDIVLSTSDTINDIMARYGRRTLINKLYHRLQAIHQDNDHKTKRHVPST